MFISHKFYFCSCGYRCSFLGLYCFYMTIILRSKAMRPIIIKVGLMLVLQKRVFVYIYM